MGWEAPMAAEATDASMMDVQLAARNPTTLPLEPASGRKNLGLRLKWSQEGRRVESKLSLVDAKNKGQGSSGEPMA